MEKIEIKFSPLFKLSSLNEVSNYHFEKCCPGVYIWGFKKEGRFIPYYVGEAIKNILERLNQHKKDIEVPNSTYVRLKYAYLKGEDITPYWIDKDFPDKNTKGLDNWCKNNQKKVYIWKNMEQVERKKKLSLDNKVKDDPLCENGIFDPYFFYWNILNGYSDINAKNSIIKMWEKFIELGEYKRDFLEIFECFIKYSLKGKTVSKSITVESMRKRYRFLFDSDIEFSFLKINESEEDASKYFYLGTYKNLENVKYHSEREPFQRCYEGNDYSEFDPYKL